MKNLNSNSRHLNFLIFISIIFFSCKNDLKVSVFEPLPNEVVLKHIQQDSLFNDFYKNVRKLSDSVFISKSNFPQFSSLQYYELYNSQKEYNENVKKLFTDQNVRKKWLEFFGRDLEKLKSDSLKFLNYIKENDYRKFVDIEPLKVYKIQPLGQVHYFIDLSIKPKNGLGIRKLMGNVYILPKSEIFDSLKINSIFYNEAFFSFTGYEKNKFILSARNSNGDFYRFSDIPVEVISQEYNFHFKITDLVVDDKFIDPSFKNIPNSMKEILRGEYEFYRINYIKDYINGNFKNYNQFIYDSASHIDKLRFPLEHQFFNEGFKIYYKLEEKIDE
ncbi:hypothetical protein [Cecembia lonarensis]|uniref:Uncharacterized protein n=1 Tax=Cecembia lonarensis (strain CCUG 58316 / KCTC 22772 / LW9) TaxID=1225176 RepID=K1LA91_CECL9|nr:hypothetical protein [Cecembia lonarensis]EKB47288.1 hypothetical protein B879_04116 [Cecembia lonarensis LW9]